MFMNNRFVKGLILDWLVGTFATSVYAWPMLNGVAVCTTEGRQILRAAVSDNTGGAIIIWHDERNGGSDLYGQRANNNGTLIWSSNGIAICTTDDFSNSEDIDMIADPGGGAFISWTGMRNGISHIFGQHLTNSGILLWTAEGDTICTATTEFVGNITFHSPRLSSEGADDAILAWKLEDDWPPTTDIYAQRLDSYGATYWSDTGVAIWLDNLLYYIREPKTIHIVSDNASGAIISWSKTKDQQITIYAQRINHNGEILWPVNGVTICSGLKDIVDMDMISDGNGGAIMTWLKVIDEADFVANVYAQKINRDGQSLWSYNGLAICQISGKKSMPKLVSDGFGGAIIAWVDYRDDVGDVNPDIYAQRVSSSGQILWNLDGISIAYGSATQNFVNLIPDGHGGAIITWQEYLTLWNADIFAQRVNSLGAKLWSTNGVPISIAANFQAQPFVVSDGSGGAIIVWNDWRNDDGNYTNSDIYAQRVDEDGSIYTSVSVPKQIWELYN